jgi:hypothetical protein
MENKDFQEAMKGYDDLSIAFGVKSMRLRCRRHPDGRARQVTTSGTMATARAANWMPGLVVTNPPSRGRAFYRFGSELRDSLSLLIASS